MTTQPPDVQFIRVESRAQIAALIPFAAAIWEEFYTPIIGAEQVAYMLQRFQSLESVTRQVEQEHYRYFTIHHAGGLVGYLAIQTEAESRSLFLSKLYLSAASRGHGIARTALHWLEELAHNEGVQRIHLTVNRHNERARQIYLQAGFRIYDEVDTEIGEGYQMNDYLLEKIY